jgi:MFS family permease
MKKENTCIILLIFLLGIFLGALDSGIVSPAREIIQRTLGVDSSLGTWIITIYTMFYAVSMPIVSKLGDLFGYKKIYITSISVFALGSFLSGFSDFIGSFEVMLIGRITQAIGAGGIVPIANAMIGQSFPKLKEVWRLDL